MTQEPSVIHRLIKARDRIAEVRALLKMAVSPAVKDQAHQLEMAEDHVTLAIAQLETWLGRQEP